MILKIRLKTPIHKKASIYKIVLMNLKTSRNGKSLENLGIYHKHKKFLYLNRNRFGYWLSIGAQPTKRLISLLNLVNELPKL